MSMLLTRIKNAPIYNMSTLTLRYVPRFCCRRPLFYAPPYNNAYIIQNKQENCISKFMPITVSDLSATFRAESSGGRHATVPAKPRHFLGIRRSGGWTLWGWGGINRRRSRLWYELLWYEFLGRRVFATPLRAPYNQDDPECQMQGASDSKASE